MKKHLIICIASFSLFIVPCFASGSGGGGSTGGGGGVRFSGGGGGSYKKKPKEKKQIDQERQCGNRRRCDFIIYFKTSREKIC